MRMRVIVVVLLVLILEVICIVCILGSAIVRIDEAQPEWGEPCITTQDNVDICYYSDPYRK